MRRCQAIATKSKKALISPFILLIAPSDPEAMNDVPSFVLIRKGLLSHVRRACERSSHVTAPNGVVSKQNRRLNHRQLRL